MDQNSFAGHLLPALYQAEATHWWTTGMRRVTHSLLAGVPLPDGTILEVGCGAGAFLAELCERIPGRPVLGCDLRPLALERAQSLSESRFELLAADLHDLPLPPGHCATVIALDAYDQRGVDLASALRESWRVLTIGGILLLRVSAFAWLQGPHDVAFGTGRRFVAGELRRSLTGAGLQVERVTYANSLLFVPGAGLRLLQLFGLMTDVARQLDVAPPLNQLFRAVLAAEARWLRHHDLPAGLSLYAIARKTDPSQH